MTMPDAYTGMPEDQLDGTIELFKVYLSADLTSLKTINSSLPSFLGSIFFILDLNDRSCFSSFLSGNDSNAFLNRR